MTEKTIIHSNQIAATEDPVDGIPISAAAVRLDDITTAVDPKPANDKPGVASQYDNGNTTATPSGPDGPPVSKKLGNKNAVTHGLSSKFALLPWEPVEDFDRLHYDFREEWNPIGRSEEEAVFDLTRVTWLKRRDIVSANLRFYQSIVSDELKSGASSWDDIMRHQMKVPQHASAAVSAIQTMIEGLTETYEKIHSLPYWTDTEDGKEVQMQLLKLKKDVNDLIAETKAEGLEGVRQLVKVVHDSATRFEQAYQPDEIEKQIDRQGKFDARIEKIIRRLTGIKVFKHVDGVEAPTPRLVESPPVAPAENEAPAHDKREKPKAD